MPVTSTKKLIPQEAFGDKVVQGGDRSTVECFVSCRHGQFRRTGRQDFMTKFGLVGYAEDVGVLFLENTLLRNSRIQRRCVLGTEMQNWISPILAFSMRLGVLMPDERCATINLSTICVSPTVPSRLRTILLFFRLTTYSLFNSVTFSIMIIAIGMTRLLCYDSTFDFSDVWGDFYHRVVG